MLEAWGLQKKAAGDAGSSRGAGKSVAETLYFQNGRGVEKMRGVWKLGSKGRCSGQRSLGGLGEELEAVSRQCGRFGKSRNSRLIWEQRGGVLCLCVAWEVRNKADCCGGLWGCYGGEET